MQAIDSNQKIIKGASYSYNGLGERVAKLKDNGQLVPPPPPPPTPQGQPCDVNGDGRINKADITTLKAILTGKTPRTYGADCNGDGVVNTQDLIDLQDMLGVTKPGRGKIFNLSLNQALAVDIQPLPSFITITDPANRNAVVTQAAIIDILLNLAKLFKGVADPDTVFTYSDGKQEGEYDAKGNLVQETFWLDDMPVAIVQSKNQVLYSIDADHLNTPRQVKDAAGRVVWQWDSGAFGSNPAQVTATTNVVNQANQITMNLRYPGQYYDAETKLHYNYLRTYNPATGRYLESDPIGLQGGINTYGYVDGNPINSIDPFGLVQCVADIAGKVMACVPETGDDRKPVTVTIRAGKAGPCQNNSACENQHGEGPLPAQEYDMRVPGDYKKDFPKRGPIWDGIYLRPAGGKRTKYGRSGFFIHTLGPDEKGCIVVPNVDDFATIKNMWLNDGQMGTTYVQ